MLVRCGLLFAPPDAGPAPIFFLFGAFLVGTIVLAISSKHDVELVEAQASGGHAYGKLNARDFVSCLGLVDGSLIQPIFIRDINQNIPELFTATDGAKLIDAEAAKCMNGRVRPDELRHIQMLEITRATQPRPAMEREIHRRRAS